MTSIKHAKQTGLPADAGVTSKVQPSDWYADHVIDNLDGGALLARFGSQTDVTVNPDPTSATFVPGMSLTLTTRTQDVTVRFALTFTSSGGNSRFMLNVDGTDMWPEYGGSGGYAPVADAEGYGFALPEIAVPLSLSAGSHTIQVRETAVASTNGKTYKQRLLEVWDGTAGSGSLGSIAAINGAAKVYAFRTFR